MRIKTFISALFVSTLIITSCQTEVDGILPETPPPSVGGDSNLLKIYAELDTTLTAPADTLLKYHLEYDASKRINKVTGFLYAEDYKAEIILTYVGNTLQTETRASNLAGTADFDTLNGFYRYDLQGRLVSDSSVGRNPNNGDYKLVHFQYYYGPVLDSTLRKLVQFDGSINLDSYRHYRTLSAGNIVAQKDTTNNVYTNSLVTYDTKNNPAAQLNKLLGEQILFWGIGPISNFQTNNITEITQEDGLSGSTPTNRLHVKYYYKYNALNYPESMIIDDLINAPAPTHKNKGIFIYTN